jgi:hypothetical protein
MRQLSGVSIDSSLEDVMVANTDLMHLSDDFVHAARTFGKIIISEVFLPVGKKTIRPRTIGGIVGGEKYIVHNILFKFAFDHEKLFGGNDGAAAKVSDQEMKGLMTFFSLDLPSLFFPMMALVRYRGFTVVAMTLLPVDRSTLVYGSHDGGKTVHKSNLMFDALMKTAGGKLNLRPHLCGAKAEQVKELWCAADIEGHVGFDKHLYLLDFGRAMPPVTPNKKFHNGHIYQLFRREFVASYTTPLCSDAYSGFVMHDPNRLEFNRDVDLATQYLFSTVIPDCGRQLLDYVMQYGDLGSMVVEVLHQNGINLRYIGRLLSTFHAQNLMVASFYGESVVQTVINMLLLEATARVIKNQMHAKLRELMKEIKEPVEVVYRQMVVDFLNVVFGRGIESEGWWLSTLTEDLNLYFSVGRYLVVGDQNGIEYSMWRKEVCVGKLETEMLRSALFSRVLELCGTQV